MNYVVIFHPKGGVGKTTSAVNLSHCAATRGRKVLLCDLDPQGSASFYLRASEARGGNAQSFARGKGLEGAIQTTIYDNLDILPSSVSHRNLEVTLAKLKRSKQRLKEGFKKLPENYDYVIIDAAPGLTLVAENLFRLADCILTPLVPTPLSLESFHHFRRFLAEMKGKAPPMAAFFSMVEARKKIHSETVRQLLISDGPYIPVSIPNNAAIERMGVERAPLATYQRRGPSVKAYLKIWEYVCTTLAPLEESDNPWFYGRNSKSRATRKKALSRT